MLVEQTGNARCFFDVFRRLIVQRDKRGRIRWGDWEKCLVRAIVHVFTLKNASTPNFAGRGVGACAGLGRDELGGVADLAGGQEPVEVGAGIPHKAADASEGDGLALRASPRGKRLLFDADVIGSLCVCQSRAFIIAHIEPPLSYVNQRGSLNRAAGCATTLQGYFERNTAKQAVLELSAQGWRKLRGVQSLVKPSVFPHFGHLGDAGGMTETVSPQVHILNFIFAFRTGCGGCADFFKTSGCSLSYFRIETGSNRIPFPLRSADTSPALISLDSS